jgi:pseudouridine-5'-phosphate glycosidase
VLVVNPIAAEDELPATTYDRALGEAIADAERAGVRGRAATPFLLDRMRVLTGGESVEVNRALLVNNARLAADLAVPLASW